MTIVFSRFAPTDEDPAFRKITDGKRPDHAPTRAFALVEVGERQLAFVADRSAQRREILGCETAPTAKFPTYAAFAFPNGLQVGLWSTQAKNFVSGGSGHRSELAFMLDDEKQVRQLHDTWQQQGVIIEQPPHKAVFGLTFVAKDPDGHRIRVCLPDRT